MPESACPGCGVELPVHEGPVHRYMASSPACWAKYGELLTREYSDPAYFRAHRLTVDSYAVQHPGQPSPQSIQSVAVHLMALHVILELGFDDDRARTLLRTAADHGRFVWLEPPTVRPVATVLHPLAADSAEAHAVAVREWALAAWATWHDHQERIRAWARAFAT
jgi:hypothetical protein